MIKYNERIAINNKEITDEEISDLLNKVSKKIDIYNDTHEIKVKEFEIITLIALIYFAENNCDIVVLETGLGGIYDCTNISDGLVSVITDIGLDHMDILGNTIEEITAQKAGIIKENNHTVMYFQDKVTEIIKKTCISRNNTLHIAKKENIENYSLSSDFQKFDYKNYKEIQVNLKGKCQIYNAILVLETIDILNNKGYNINLKHIKEGLKTVVHKARFEKIYENPEIIFDGGHNEKAIINLKQIINDNYPKDKKIYIVSILKSKDYKTIIKLLTEDKDGTFIFTSGNDENRYVSKEYLYEEAKKNLNRNIYTCDLKNAIKNVKGKCIEEKIIICR